MVDLPSAEHVAMVAVAVLGAIVVWDAYWLTKQRRDVPELGRLAGGGFAWASEGVHEMVRQWGNLGSMAAMMVLPWALLEASNADCLRHPLGRVPRFALDFPVGSQALRYHVHSPVCRRPTLRLGTP